MDIQLARTFLEVVAAGSFVGAAERLNVTQSTVSMRVRSLEGQLGRPLFERSKAGAALTPAGLQFQRHATALVRIWEQARHDVALPAGYRGVLAVGAQVSLWDGLLLRWLSWMRSAAPEVALRAEFGTSEALMRRLVEGTLELGVMYTPQSRPGLNVELLLEEKLILVSTQAKPPADRGRDYVLVDWGPEFRADHGINYPELASPSLILGLGSLSLSYLLDAGGSGYFPRRLVRPYLDSGTLKPVRRAPAFSYPAYLVYPAEGRSESFDLALEGLRRIAGIEAEA